MTKYVIIAGVPRAGKSTVSKMIAKRYGYQHISMDSIIAGIEKVFPETGIDTGAAIDPQRNLENISGKDCKIYYFLSSDTTPEERFHILKEHDTPNDYTYYHSDEENKKDCIDIVNNSKMIKGQCISCGLPYYETSYERDKVLAMFMTEHIKCV